MEIPTFKICCLKISCGITADIDVSGARKDGDKWSPVNSKRPIGWIAGPADIADLTSGICPTHAAEWEEAKRSFIEKDLPPPAPIPRKHDIPLAKSAPIGNILVETVESRTHAPIEAPRPLSMSAFPTPCQTIRPAMIQPSISQANGGYGAAMPPSLPSQPFMPLNRSAGAQITAPAITSPAEISMGVTTKTSPLPNHINCTPDPTGQFIPAHHNYQTSSQSITGGAGVTLSPFAPAVANFNAGGGGPDNVEVTMTPFEPVSPVLLSAKQ